MSAPQIGIRDQTFFSLARDVAFVVAIVRCGSGTFSGGFAPNWSVAVEYDHLFMGNHSRDFASTGVLGAGVIPVGGVFRTVSIHQDVDLITARINYRFNWGGPVVGKY